MKPESMDAVFHALASAPRRRILDLIKNMPGCSVNDVSKYFEMSRIGVMKHLAVLEDAELIISQKSGRTRELYFNAVPIQLIYDRWTTEYSALWASHAADIQRKAEAKGKSKGKRNA
jgi:predicted transcriptional regulator